MRSVALILSYNVVWRLGRKLSRKVCGVPFMVSKRERSACKGQRTTKHTFSRNSNGTNLPLRYRTTLSSASLGTFVRGRREC